MRFLNTKKLFFLAILGIVVLGFSSVSLAKQPDRDVQNWQTEDLIRSSTVWYQPMVYDYNERSELDLGGYGYNCGTPSQGHCDELDIAYEVCGGRVVVDKEVDTNPEGDWDGLFSGDYVEYYVYQRPGEYDTVYESSPRVPNEMGCTPGVHEFKRSWTDAYGGEVIREIQGNVVVSPKTKGTTLEVTADVGTGVSVWDGPDPVNIGNMKLTDETPPDKSGSGWIKITESDTFSSSTKWRRPKTGFVMDDESYNLNNVLETPLKSCTRKTDEPCSVATLTFEYTNTDKFSTSECTAVDYGNTCPFGHYSTVPRGFNREKEIAYGFLNSELIRGVSYGDGENPQTDSKFDESYVDQNGKIIACGEYTYHQKPVYSPVKSKNSEFKYDQFVCNYTTGEWKSVSICNDGVDNDGNGKADFKGTREANDITTETRSGGGLPSDGSSGCESLSDSTETYEGDTCKPTVGVLSDSVASSEGLEDRKVAFFDSGGDAYTNQISDSGCTYGSYQSEIPSISDTEVEFTCDDSGNMISHPLTSTGSLKYSSISKGDIKKKMQYSASQECTEIALMPYSHSGEMNVAQIKLREEFIQFGEKYAGSAGYMPFKNQRLHDAEFKYVNLLSPHDYGSLFDKNIPLSKIDAYKSPENPSQFSNAWTVSNYLSRDNQKTQSGMKWEFLTENVQFEYYFKGGYSLDCPKDRPFTVYQGEWTCLPNNYKVPFDYVLPDVEKESDYVGFKLLNSTFERFKMATGSQLNQVKGECWAGGPSDRSLNPNVEFNEDNLAKSSLSEQLKQNMDGGTYNIRVAAKDLERGKFSCSWNLTSADGNKYTGGNRFEPRNLYDRSDRAGKVAAAVKGLINERAVNIQQRKFLREAFLPDGKPDFNMLVRAYYLPDKLKQSFFKSSGIKE